MDFPLEDLIPRKETNALDFLQKYPTYDGRGVRIGILDTGICPSATGITEMADGITPKLVDLVDCTGSGDVDLSFETVAEWKDDYWQVTGITGRELKLNSSWTFEAFPNAQESKEVAKEGVKTVPVRLGVKRAYELFPKGLTSRVQKDRIVQLEAALAPRIASVRAELAKLPDTLTAEQVKTRDDWQARLDILIDSSWRDDDPGPLYDCVVFYDGTDYRAVIDVKEDGDLLNAKPMTSYAKERQFGTLGTVDQLQYSVNFYDDAKTLTIVCDASPHGTHVAGICAAAEGPRSGVAPGAELVSLKIGDSRLGSMETGTALTRAMNEAVRLKCDIINLSYGEGCRLPNTGRFVELAEELVWKHNVIFVSSAGNNGPALSTVGAPGGTSSALIGVAAYVSPHMMKTDYSLPLKEGISSQGDHILKSGQEQFVGSTFTWSSVGPAVDGDNGVDITAPGGAVTSVSLWCLQKSMLMNGTSMSSPACAGNITLLLSACKAEGIPISQPRIKRAIQTTAKFLPNLLAPQQGWGMVQVDAAMEHLRKFRDVGSEDIHFQVTIENKIGNPRGIYLRQHDECSIRQAFSVNVDPQFRREDVVGEETQQRKIAFEMAFSIESTASWVIVPDKFMLMNNGRSFKFEVDPKGLAPGVHTARVIGIDAQLPDRKAIFSVPVTVAKPMPISRVLSLGKLSLEPSEVRRFFLTPPAGSTWVDITIRDCRDDTTDDEAGTRLVALHTVQLLPHAAYRDFEKQKYLSLLPGQESVTSVSVEEGITIELTIARYWNTIGATDVDVSVEFRGIRPVPCRLTMTSGEGAALVRIHSDLKAELVNPSAKLSKWQTPVRPKAGAVVSPLGQRDSLPSYNRKVYEIVFTYEFTQEEKGSFTPRAPALNGVLYESAFESQLMLVFDGDKKYLGVSDAFASSVTAPKGPVTIRLQVRHDDPKKLEKLKDLCIWIERSLDKELPLSCYASKEAAMASNSTFKKCTLRKGSSAAVFVGNPTYSKLPSGCKCGDILLGSVTYASGETSLSGEGRRPGGFPISYIIGPKPEKSSSEPETPEAKDERSVEEKMNDAVRDFKVNQLEKLTAKEKQDGKFEEQYTRLEAEFPDFLPLLMARLKYLDTHEKRGDHLPSIVSAAESLVAKIAQDGLALHFGRKSDSEDPAAVKLRKDMKEKKGFLIDALCRMALAYDDMTAEDAGEKFSDTLKKLKEWVDVDSSDKYAAVSIARDVRAGRYGLALANLSKLINGKEVKDAIKPLSKAQLLEKRAHIFARLGFDELVELDKKNRVISCPKTFAPF